MDTFEENLDHLPTIYFNLHCPVVAMNSTKPKPPIQTFSAAPSIAPKPSNPPYKPRSRPMTYEDLSPEQKALYDRCKSEAMIPAETRLNEKLFRQVANKAAFSTKPSSTVSQSEFSAYQNSFALSKEEERLQKLLLDQVSGHAETV